MNQYLKDGWRAALRQPFALITLFIYQLLWGVALYKAIQSIVVPLMHRYPSGDQPSSAIQLFLAESQFQLFKTDISHSYLWWLAVLLGARMLLTPLLNAGVYYSLIHTELQAGYRFFKGIRELFLPFALLYLVQMILTLTPLLWLLPKAQELFRGSGSYEAILNQMLPWLLGFLIYGYILRIAFMHLQFAKAHQQPAVASLWIFLSNFLSISLLALIPLLVSAFTSLSVITLSYIWAGLLALLVYQLYPLLGLLLQLWSLSSQYQLWSAKVNR